MEANNVDHFARIPAELLVSILSRLENLKYMCQCSLVSKRFALSIYQIKSVTLTLPSTEIPSTETADEIDELFMKMAGFTSEEIIRFIQSSSIKELKFFPFLQNFRQLRSISLEFTCARSVCSSSLFKMRVRFTSQGAVMEKFVSIVADSVCRMTERVYNVDYSYRKQSITGTFLPFGCCIIWLLVLCLLLKCQPLLVSVAITNSKKQGKLVLRDEQLVAWRNSLVPGGLLNDFTPYAHTTGCIYMLRMPESGYQLNTVSYVIARLRDSRFFSGAGPVTWQYSGDERLLGDALREFIRRYGDPFILSELAR